MYMMELKMKNCLKNMKVWTVTIIRVIIVLKIIGDSVTKRNFTVHFIVVEYMLIIASIVNKLFVP
jgi:hypothetical protein